MAATTVTVGPVRQRTSAWGPAVRGGLSVWAASWVSLLVAGLVLAHLWPPHSRLPGHGLVWLVEIFARQDAGHFARIAHYGYLSRGRGDVNVAFFPGYPVAGRLLAHLLGFSHPSVTDYLTSLALISWAGSASAAVLLWRYLAQDAGTVAARLGTAALVAGPCALFLVASYSEGPFLALALAAWLAARRARWTAAGLFCAGAALIRVNGLFLLAGLVVLYVQQSRDGGSPSRRSATQRSGAQLSPAYPTVRRPLRRRHAQALPLLLPLAAVGGYETWLRVATGDWGDWFRAERLGWQRQTEWPWRTLAHSIQNTTTPGLAGPERYQAALQLLFAGVYVIGVLALAHQRRWPEFTYVALTAASLLTSSYYQSVPRSTLVCFPLYLVAAGALRHRSRALLGGITVVTLALLAINTALFVHGYGVG